MGITNGPYGICDGECDVSRIVCLCGAASRLRKPAYPLQDRASGEGRCRITSGGIGPWRDPGSFCGPSQDQRHRKGPLKINVAKTARVRSKSRNGPVEDQGCVTGN